MRQEDQSEHTEQLADMEHKLNEARREHTKAGMGIYSGMALLVAQLYYISQEQKNVIYIKGWHIMCQCKQHSLFLKAVLVLLILPTVRETITINTSLSFQW